MVGNCRAAYVRQTCFLLLVWTTTMAPSRASADPAVLRVDRRYYSAMDVFGKSQAELRADFDAETSTLSDEGLRSSFNRYLEPGQTVPQFAGRKAAEEWLWACAFKDLLRSAARYSVVTAIGNNVARRYGLDLTEYFDPVPINDAFTRELDFDDFLYSHRDDPQAQDDVLFAKAKTAFRLTISLDYWKLIRQEIRGRLRFTRWNVTALRRFGSGESRERLLGFFAAHFLLQDACLSGMFHDRAERYYQVSNSSFQFIEISGYPGSPSGLDEFFKSVIDSDGILAHDGVNILARWLSLDGGAARVDVSEHLGSDLVRGFIVPEIGVMAHPAPEAYRIVVWDQKREVRPSSPEAVKAIDIFCSLYAYKIAATEFMPSTEALGSGWSIDGPLLSESISVDSARFLFPDVEYDKTFIRKPVPEGLFNEFESSKAALVALELSAATAEVNRDSELATKTIAKAAQLGRLARTRPVQRAFDEIAGRLEDQMKSHVPSSQLSATEQGGGR